MKYRLNPPPPTIFSITRTTYSQRRIALFHSTVLNISHLISSQKNVLVFFESLSIVGKPLSKQRMSIQQYRQSATGSFPDILSKGELINFSPFGGLSYCHFPRFRPFRVSVIGSLRCLMSPRQKRRRGGGEFPTIDHYCQLLLLISSGQC